MNDAKTAALPDLDPADILVEVVPHGRQGFGALYANTGVRVTHRPSGVSVVVDSDRSAHKNKHLAMEMLRGVLALQPQPAAAVSDEEIWGLWDSQERSVAGWACPVKFARAILALRPQAVPSLDTLKQHLACDIECSVYENTVLPAIERWECHHGITAQGAQGGEG